MLKINLIEKEETNKTSHAGLLYGGVVVPAGIFLITLGTLSYTTRKDNTNQLIYKAQWGGTENMKDVNSDGIYENVIKFIGPSGYEERIIEMKNGEPVIKGSATARIDP